MIILVTGLKRSGKDTLADYLVNKLNYRRYAFADPIREVCKIIFDWTDEHFQGGLKETIDPYFGISPRQALQWIGTEGFQYKINEAFPLYNETVGRTIWVRKFLKWRERNKDIENIVIPDWRFPHERETIINDTDEEKLFIRIHNNRITADDVHESEIHIPKLPVNFVISNNSTLNEFYKNIDKIFHK